MKKRLFTIGVLLLVALHLCACAGSDVTEPSILIDTFGEKEETYIFRTDINNIDYIKEKCRIIANDPKFFQSCHSSNNVLYFYDFEKVNVDQNPFNDIDQVFKFPGRIINYLDKSLYSYNKYGNIGQTYHCFYLDDSTDIVRYCCAVDNDKNKFNIIQDFEFDGIDLFFACSEYVDSDNNRTEIGILSTDRKTIKYLNPLGNEIKEEHLENPVVVTGTSPHAIAFDGANIFNLYNHDKKIELDNTSGTISHSFFIPDEDFYPTSVTLYSDGTLYRINTETMSIEAENNFGNIYRDSAEKGWIINDTGVYFLDRVTLDSVLLIEGGGWNYHNSEWWGIEPSGPIAGRIFTRYIDNHTELKLMITMGNQANIVSLQDIDTDIDCAIINPSSSANGVYRIHIGAFTKDTLYHYMSKWPIKDEGTFNPVSFHK